MSQDERRPSVPERRPSVAEVKARFEAMQKAANQLATDQGPPPQPHDPQTHPLPADEPAPTTTTTTIDSLSPKSTQKFSTIATAVRARNIAARPAPPADHSTGYENSTSFQGRFDHQSRKDGCPAFWPPDRERRVHRKSKDGEE